MRPMTVEKFEAYVEATSRWDAARQFMAWAKKWDISPATCLNCVRDWIGDEWLDDTEDGQLFIDSVNRTLDTNFKPININDALNDVENFFNL